MFLKSPVHYSSARVEWLGGCQLVVADWHTVLIVNYACTRFWVRLVFLIHITILLNGLTLILKGCIVIICKTFHFHYPVVVRQGTGVPFAVRLSVSNSESIVATLVLASKAMIVTTSWACICTLYRATKIRIRWSCTMWETTSSILLAMSLNTHAIGWVRD